MYKYKILFKVTGSIAAYKSAYLISKLVQSGCEVKVVASEYALKFVGNATFEGLTGNQVYADSFAQNSVMSHINLVKWADLTIICPATANTINKLASGISDTLLTSLFLAHDWSKPYLIAPAMNSLMYSHPATQESLRKLKQWGVKILPTAEGYLACGDIGKGKLLEPDEIFNFIFETLHERRYSTIQKNILITSGGTKENIDGVRYISNMSTGKTASSIAEYFFRNGYKITFLHAKDSQLPNIGGLNVPFNSFTDLDDKLKKYLSEYSYDAIIHLAAVSDYSPISISFEKEKINLPAKKKINSEADSITISFKRNYKILEKLKSYSQNKNILVIGFKLTTNAAINEKTEAAKKILNSNQVDIVVANDLSDRTENQEQTNFDIYTGQLQNIECHTIQELSEALEKIIMEKK